MITRYDETLFSKISSSIIKEAAIKKEINNNPFAKYFLYIENGSIVAFLYYSEIYDRVEINQIEVEYSYRNKGIGTKLLKELTNSVEKNMTLEVKINNYPAINLYKKFNFKEVAIRQGYYKGVDGILMERKYY